MNRIPVTVAPTMGKEYMLPWVRPPPGDSRVIGIYKDLKIAIAILYGHYLGWGQT